MFKNLPRHSTRSPVARQQRIASSVARQVWNLSTTDDVGRYNFRPRYNFNVTPPVRVLTTMDNNTENTVRTLLSLLLIWSRSQIEPTLTGGFFEYANKRKHPLTPCLPFTV